MVETMTCPKCGAEVPDNAPAGICPSCLMQAGLPGEPDTGSGPEMKPTTALMSSFVPPEPEELAKHFPQLEILELLGMGGMGAVYKARQPALGRLVAVKILPPEIEAEPAFAERFTREARALATLNHQNIVSIYDFGQADGQWYFIMEFVDGANLRQLIESGGIRPKEALAIVPQLCEALQFAHGEGVVHRDIKPENILIDKQGRAKIADFGLAKLLGKVPARQTLTGTHQVMGTPHYMAPEQMQGSRAVDHRADIYSLGVVFYEMLTGELPIGRFEPPSNKVQIDVRLDDVVLRALASEPEKRYQRASEVRTDVESISHSSAPLSEPNDATAAHKPVGSKPTVTHLPVDDLAEIRSELEAPSLIMMVLGLLMVAGHVITIVVCLQNRFDADTAWIGMPGVIVGCFMIVGGLSLRYLWSAGWAYLGTIAALIPAGPGWLITAFVGIWILNVLARPHVRAAFIERSLQARESIRPRFSRKTFLGADESRMTSESWLPVSGLPGPEKTPLTGSGNSVKDSLEPFVAELRVDVMKPALGLVSIGSLSILVQIGLFFYLYGWWIEYHPALQPRFIGWLGLHIMLLCLAATIWMIYGAVSLLNLSSLRDAQVAAIAAILPLPGILIGIPFGVWALAVLSRPEVQSQFRLQTADAALWKNAALVLLFLHFLLYMFSLVIA